MLGQIQGLPRRDLFSADKDRFPQRRVHRLQRFQIHGQFSDNILCRHISFNLVPGLLSGFIQGNIAEIVNIILRYLAGGDKFRIKIA